MPKTISSLYENENLKKGDRQKRKPMSLCKNEKNQIGVQTKMKKTSHPSTKLKN
jgi:hypothetical protein